MKHQTRAKATNSKNGFVNRFNTKADDNNRKVLLIPYYIPRIVI